MIQHLKLLPSKAGLFDNQLRMRTPLWLAVFVFFATMLIIDNSIAAVHVITTQRPSAELVPILEAHVGEGGHVQAADGFKLIIRADDDAIRNIRSILEQLDRPLTLLKIEVSFGEARNKAAHEIGVGATTTLTQSGVKATARGNIKSYSTDSARHSEHSVVVMEGERAWVQSGVSQPYQSSNIYGTSTDFKDVRQGFYVTPRLAGPNVHLRISTQNNSTMKHNNQTVKINEAETVTVAPLNEWTPIAQGNDSSKRTDRGWVYSTERRESRNRDVFVRVSIAEP